MVNIKYQKLRARELMPGDIFATVGNPGTAILTYLKHGASVNVGPPDGALAFGHFHVRTEEPMPEEDAEATVYRITVEVL